MRVDAAAWDADAVVFQRLQMALVDMEELQLAIMSATLCLSKFPPLPGWMGAFGTLFSFDATSVSLANDARALHTINNVVCPLWLRWW